MIARCSWTPGFAKALFGKATALEDLGVFDEVVTCCEGALDLDPTFGEAAWVRAAALANIGRSLEAIAAYDQALALQPGDPTLLLQKAAIAQKAGQEGVALETLRQFTVSAPSTDTRLARARELVAALEAQGAPPPPPKGDGIRPAGALRRWTRLLMGRSADVEALMGAARTGQLDALRGS